MVERPHLRALADRAGILPDYVDCTGAVRVTSDPTRELLLAAMWLDASSESAAQRSLQEKERRDQERLIDPVQVVSKHHDRPPTIRFRVPEGQTGVLDWHITLNLESGQVHRVQGQVTLRKSSGKFDVSLPVQPETGYHRLTATLRTSRSERTAEQSLIITPGSCVSPADAFGNRRLVGLWTNLYTVVSKRNWGVGNFSDLRQLMAWARDSGAGFVGVNPLHAHRNRGDDISPYRAVSRIYRNVLYLDVTAIPELEDCAKAQSMMASGDFRQKLQSLRDATIVNYGGISDLMKPVLIALHQTFVERHRDHRTLRGQAYSEYCSQQGDSLRDFAVFCELEEHFEREGIAAAGGWRTWPSPYQDPHSAGVESYRREHAEQVDLHCYIQFELDRQLGLAASEAKQNGMPIGLYQDLALGSSPDGFEPWAFPDLFVTGASIGAPPDPLGPAGQDWGLPPLHPRRLFETGYAYWIQLLRSMMAYSGALRIDHVMGLLRQYWIPVGQPSSTGAYVRYPIDDLLGILALESHRHGAVIVGEDLGTVPAGFHELMAKWGLLSSRVLYFERDWHGNFKPSSEYSSRALVTVNTHDLVPLAGYWKGRDFELRKKVGQFSPEQCESAQNARNHERQALCRRLSEEGLLQGAHPSYPDLCAAVHQFLARTPAPLVGLSLDDLVGETEPVNLPGTLPNQYPSWCRRMKVPIDDLPHSSIVKKTMISR